MAGRSNTMFLDDIFERNRAYVRGREPHALPPVAKRHLAIVGCYDPRLDELLLPSLGLVHGDAFLLRSAGALLYPGSSSMRSLALAIYMFGVHEVLIVGHVACRMAAFDTASFIEEFRRRGVSRDAFGEESLRSWVGAIASPREGVLMSVAAVREAPFVPKDVLVAGVVLDETSGALEVIVRPDQPVEGAGARVATTGSRGPLAGGAVISGPVTSVGPSSTTAAAGAAPSSSADETPRPAPRTVPPPPPAAPAGKLSKARDRAARAVAGSAAAKQTAAGAPSDSRVAQTRAMVKAVDDFLSMIQTKEHWRRDLENLRDELEQRTDPRQRLELLDAFGRRLAGESREVSDAFKKLRQHMGAGGADPTAEILSVFQYLGGRR